MVSWGKDAQMGMEEGKMVSNNTPDCKDDKGGDELSVVGLLFLPDNNPSGDE